MKIERESSLREVAFTVCTALHRAGVEAVLTGGSAATVYAPHAYQSNDLDFIVTFRAPTSAAADVLTSLGYREVDGHYEHTTNGLVLEFPRGPLAIGGDLIEKWETLREGQRILYIISPTDSCRDRLAGFMFWHDRGSLAQAAAVARDHRQEIDMKLIRNWCRAEGKEDALAAFEQELSR